MESLFRGRHVVVTGGTGAFGQKLFRYLSDASVSKLTLLSRDEMKHAAMKRMAGVQCPWVRFQIGDICNPDDLERAFRGADIVIHAAAMKHLPECELNIEVSTRVNVEGTRNVVQAFERSTADTLVFLSTDKSPYASSVYGAQKYIGEKLITECAARLDSERRAFSLRYSNVVDSTGAAFHLFGNMLREGKKVTVNGTHTKRGFVTQAEAIATIEAGLRGALGGEAIVIRPRVIRIAELATTMRELMGRGEVEVKETTAFAGEKDSATLVMEEELPVTREFSECETTSYLVDHLKRHGERKLMHFGHEGALTLEQCDVISGNSLKEFLLPVMKANGFAA